MRLDAADLALLEIEIAKLPEGLKRKAEALLAIIRGKDEEIASLKRNLLEALSECDELRDQLDEYDA